MNYVILCRVRKPEGDKEKVKADQKISIAAINLQSAGIF